MGILEYIYNKNSLHIVNALRIVCIIAIIIVFLYFTIISLWKANSSTMIFVSTWILFMSFVAVLAMSPVGLIGAGVLDIIEYNKS